ncbi:hypothetical protein LTR62_000355 [Meristemomyces frigidus]|uniref:Swi5-domain-containing protein n=1 Tax=Meristemomyces frigidus TaxID=1508187 RepID=A0AAN7TMH9_9PEZI|nr:hypothetical protein LTR62_000355 [Meristemomyces frigidus]
MTSQDEKSNTLAPSSLDTPVPSSPSPPKDTPAPTLSNPRLAALATKRAKLEQTLSDLQAQRAALVSQATMASGLPMPSEWDSEQRTKYALSSANAVIKEHIFLLHKYNEMKDIGQGLMGLVAEQRGVRVSEVMEGFDMGKKD